MPSVDRLEVLASIQRRRRYSLDQKLAVLAEAAQPGMSISYVGRRHGIQPLKWPNLAKPGVRVAKVRVLHA